MSRIHEALKRAEQQRTVPLEVPPPIAPEVQSYVAEPSTTPPPEILDPLAHSEIDIKTRASEFLRCDDIWTHCANPGWRLNLERKVFIDPGAPPAVREQFQPFTPLLYQIRATHPLL